MSSRLRSQATSQLVSTSLGSTSTVSSWSNDQRCVVLYQHLINVWPGGMHRQNLVSLMVVSCCSTMSGAQAPLNHWRNYKPKEVFNEEHVWDYFSTCLMQDTYLSSGHCLPQLANINRKSKPMFESLFAVVLPIAKDILITVAAGLMAYAINRLQSYVTSF